MTLNALLARLDAPRERRACACAVLEARLIEIERRVAALEPPASALALDLADPRIAREFALRLADNAPAIFGAASAVCHRRGQAHLGSVDDLARAFVAYGLTRWPRAVREALAAFVEATYGPAPAASAADGVPGAPVDPETEGVWI